jgi:hypothetical protein
VLADDLVLETLEEELPAAARAEGLIGLVPDRGLAAAGGIRGPELVERRTAGTGGYQDLSESMSTEIAVKLSTNSHLDLHDGTPQERCRGVPLFHYPRKADHVPLNGARPGSTNVR